MKLFSFDNQWFIAAKNKISAIGFSQDRNIPYKKVIEVDPKGVNFYDEENKLCNAKKLLEKTETIEPFILCFVVLS